MTKRFSVDYFLNKQNLFYMLCTTDIPEIQDFQFLAFPLLLACLCCKYLKLSQGLLTLSWFWGDSFFFLLFWLVVSCNLMFQIIDLILDFIHSTVVSLQIVLYFSKLGGPVT